MSYDTNIYYSPEKSGLSFFCSLEEDGLSYEYNMLIIMQHVETGRLFMARDRGCSCPTPFDDFYLNFEDGKISTNMEEIVRENHESACEEMANFPAYSFDEQKELQQHFKHQTHT